MKRRVIYTLPWLIAAIGLLSTASAQEPLGAVELSILPTEGKAAGIVKTSSEGRWIVFATGFMPVAAESYKLSSGGSVVMWEGEPGALFGVVFIPNDASEGIAARQVKLGTAPQPPPKPDPPGPDPPQPPPSDVSKAILIYESEETTAEWGTMVTQIRDQNLPVTILDKDTKNQDDQPLPELQAAAEAISSGLPVLVGYSDDGSVVATKSNPESADEIADALERWGVE